MIIGVALEELLIDLYLKYGGVKCIDKIDLLQQMGGKKNKELIFVFKNNSKGTL